jgi:hypothetical protein
MKILASLLEDEYEIQIERTKQPLRISKIVICCCEIFNIAVHSIALIVYTKLQLISYYSA